MLMPEEPSITNQVLRVAGSPATVYGLHAYCRSQQGTYTLVYVFDGNIISIKIRAKCKNALSYPAISATWWRKDALILT